MSRYGGKYANPVSSPHAGLHWAPLAAQHAGGEQPLSHLKARLRACSALGKVQPLILLVSIPFAATGSLLLMLATHTQLGAPSLIGLLMLVGIVITNAIVLLDLVRQYRAKGMDARTAVIEGGRRRLRPILMTAVATILALLPMALGLSKDSVFIAAPLAITVIGGLASSTILTLLVVPTLYVLVEGRQDRKNRANSKPVEEQETSKQEAILGA